MTVSTTMLKPDIRLEVLCQSSKKMSNIGLDLGTHGRPREQ
jgi:hypothetical protein